MRVEYQPQAISYEISSQEQQEVNSEPNMEKKDIRGVIKDTDYVTVELSEEALAAFREHILNDDKSWISNQEKFCEEKSAQLQEMIKGNYAKKLHHIFPNVRTNDKIERALEGQPWEFENDVYNVIYSKLLPYNVGNMTEDERKAQISDGLSELKKMSECLDANKASLFMEAMKEDAQYGNKGKMDSEGNVKYDIKEGPPIGAPDDYETFYEHMERVDPEAYEKFVQMRDKEIEKTGACWEALNFAYKWNHEWNMKHVPQSEEIIKEEEPEENLEKEEETKDTTTKDIIEKTRHEMSKMFEKYSMQQNKLQTVSYLMSSMRKFSTYA